LALKFSERKLASLTRFNTN